MFCKKAKNYNFNVFARLMFRLVFATVAVAIFAVPSHAQDDDTVPAKVMDSANRAVGKAELVLDTGDVKTNFGYNIKMWLEGNSKLRIVRPQSGSRSTGISCSFREYKVDPIFFLERFTSPGRSFRAATVWRSPAHAISPLFVISGGLFAVSIRAGNQRIRLRSIK